MLRGALALHKFRQRIGLCLRLDLFGRHLSVLFVIHYSLKRKTIGWKETENSDITLVYILFEFKSNRGWRKISFYALYYSFLSFQFTLSGFSK